jgi:hypothetical protein
MSTVLLLSQTKLKAFTTIHQNTDEALLTSGVFMAQELGLQVLLGTKGYDYYTNLVKSVQLSGATMSQSDQIMLNEYIAPYLVHRAYFEVMPEIWSRKMNKGIQVGASEQGNAVDIKGMSYLRDIELSRYNFYAQRMMDRIQAYPNDYPWYFSFTSKDGMPNSKQNYFGGIFFTPGLRKMPGALNGNIQAYWGHEYDCCGDW